MTSSARPVWPSSLQDLTARRWQWALLVLAALAWGAVTAAPPCSGCAPLILLDPCLDC